ncbi:glycerophosphodiester phosphodiesterase [Pseudoalteromonas sp. McH1-7]|uniref:glycerophosphodiester phosphodiesterase family protein n=1 Tax=unclassified Pseudoalteromonas TaxID=194690 RepID=UPI001590180A|nr:MULTISPECIES: glycerophosphodiester phosphodiesterase family protein [unclassified Pseudoalteromonas]NUZ09934.1 glycerophosphodiester phosphodiesterase [Pseudoalteromonas sp. McH1-7]USD30995.1 glycerophosphodiester phosphodiesterase [Pseudoalteromonas sp. SCSIO 43201]
MNKISILSALTAALVLCGCDDDSVEVVQVEKPVVTTKTEVKVVEVPVIVEVSAGSADNIQVGTRPDFLVQDMQSSPLKTKLAQCANGPFYKTDFSIGHRGAPMQFPEHTKESYIAAAKMGAGVLECDVTFTKDKALVCRHSQCDLHTTTNILATELGKKCTTPFVPADPANGIAAQAKCCTSDITLAEFITLQGKMDAANPNATTVDEYLNGTANWRTDLYASRGTLMTHAQSIELFKSLGVKMTPELKAPSVSMPFDGFTQTDYAQKMINEYKTANVDPKDVLAQSFNLEDVLYWIKEAPEFGTQAVYLDDRYEAQSVAAEAMLSSEQIIHSPELLSPTMQELAADGVKIIAPPLWMLLTEENGKIVPSAYANAAKAAGLGIITWTLERSGHLANGGGWYYQSINGSLAGETMINNDGDTFEVLDVLAKEVGVLGVFSDWPATTTYYASCMGMPASI